MKQKIAVIGAGLSGLATLKELLEEGHEVLCFEQRPDIGGVFNEMGTYDSVQLTVSNYFMAYSDDMPYDDKVRFWTRGEYKTYLDGYAEKFKLRPHIRFNCSLENVDVQDDKIVVTVMDTSGEKMVNEFDRLAICSGQFQVPKIPEIKGMDSFPGPMIHSNEYRNNKELEGFAGKRVLCFGMGESAADVVAEVAEIASETTLSLRRKHCFSQKEAAMYPIDVVQTRHWHSIPAKLKSETVRRIWSGIQARTTDSDPMHHLAQHMVEAPDEPGSVVTKTERIFEAVANGMRMNIGGVKEIQGSTVIFNDGESQEFDAILFCTGFKFVLPFLDEMYQPKDIRDLYLQAFHPKLRDRVAMIGFVRPQQGGVPLMAELQARYYALVCSGKRTLPENLAELAQQDKRKWEMEFYETPHVFGLVNGFRFNEQIADLIGCRPKMPNPIFSPNAFVGYWFYHVWPSQFRLVGPGARQEARDNWLKAPCYRAKDGKLTLGGKFALYKELLSCWLRSKSGKSDKEKWRPIYSRS